MKRQKGFWKVWWKLLLLLLAAGGYAAYSICVIAYGAIRYGAIDAWDYPSYAVPYIPVFLGLLTVMLFMSPILRIHRKAQLPLAALLALVVAVPAELLLENVPVYDSVFGLQNIQSWQALSCVATLAVRQTIAGLAFGERSFAVKAHFYLIALVLLLVAIHILWRCCAQAYSGEKKGRALLIAQTVCYAVFLALCILACFTAFFRTGEIRVGPVSAVLMALFFICIGVTVGVFVGSLLYSLKRLVSIGLPVLASLLITGAMYVGELMLMGGVLFRLGDGFFFTQLPGIPFAPADFGIILFAGVCTFALLLWLNRRFGSEALPVKQKE